MSAHGFKIEIYHKPHTKIFKWGYQLFRDGRAFDYNEGFLTGSGAARVAKRHVAKILKQEKKRANKHVIETKKRFDYDG